tara:strand:- start:822 stop:1670 length:849 start_codon:yes stop_codon:yes gene_type:complete
MISLTDITKNKFHDGLYIVSTPIGNLSDITIRAINVLTESEYILCEDTRNSRKLLDKYNIRTKLISNHKFNEKKNLNKIIEILKSKKKISLISDAGTPAISDPGKILINECIKNNINIYPIPGPSAVSTAISISGFSDKYFFAGFLPSKKKDLYKSLKDLSNIKDSIVIFVPPKKINIVLENIKVFFTERKILICREMTKFFEEYIKSDINKLKLFQRIPKGELTIVISEISNNLINLNDDDKEKIKKLIKISSIKDIVLSIIKEKKISKKEVYNYCLSLKK